MTDTPTSPSCPTCTFLTLHPKDPVKKRTARVEELLRQNHPPLDVELADFRLILEKSPEILQDLDAKIAQVNETLSHLKEARRAAESHLEDAKALIHPIRSIPNEVLAEIFMYTAPSWETCITDSLNPTSSPWSLTHVCRRWRDLAISLPQLWTTIKLDFDGHATHITPRQCAYKTGLYLGRSKDLHLSVILCSRASTITNHAVFPILELSVPRWERLSIVIPEQSLQSFSGNVFSRLHLVEVHHVDEGQRNGKVTTFESTPALRTAFTHDSSWEVFKKVPLPWAQLTEALGFPAFDETGLECLRKMSGLQNLEVDILASYGSIPNIIHLPKLCSLVIDETAKADPGRLEEFFSNLEIPALASLTLIYPDVAERVMFLPRLIGAVDKLTMLDISCEMSNHNKNTQNLLKFLSLLLHLEEFRLRDSAVTLQFLRGLMISSVAWKLPCLRILDIQDTYCKASLAISLPAIFDMLESRYGVVAEDASRPGMTYFLEKVCAPRWLYFRKKERWKDICNALHVECGVTLSDMDEDEEDEEASDEEEEEGEENAEETEEEMISETTS